MTAVDAKTIGRRIRAARALAGLDTQDELGELIGYSGSEVGRWERGEQTPRSIVLNAIAETCGLDRQWFSSEIEPLPERRANSQPLPRTSEAPGG